MKLLSLMSALFLSLSANAFTVTWSTTNPTSGVGPLSGSFSWTNPDPNSVGPEVNNRIVAAMNAKCQQCVNRVGIPGSTNYSSGARRFSYTPTASGGYTGTTEQTYNNPDSIVISCNNQGAQNFCASDPHNQNCAVSGSKACGITRVCVANGPSAANVSCSFQNQACNGPLTGEVIGTCSKPVDGNGTQCAQTAKTPDSCVSGPAAIPAAAYSKAVSAN